MSAHNRIVAGFAAAVALLLASGVASYRSTRTLGESGGEVARAHEVQTAASDLRAQLSAAESARRGYVLTGHARFEQAFRAAEAAARRRQQQLAGALAPGRQAELARLLDVRIAMLRETIALRRTQPEAVAVQAARTGDGQTVSEAVHRVLDELDRDQRGRVAAAEANARRSAQQATRVALGGSLIAVLLFAATSVALWREADGRRHAQQALRRSEHLMRRVLSCLPHAAVVLFDRDLRYLLAGGESLAATGLSREMLEGRTVREALPSLADQLEPVYRAALAGQESTFDVEYGGRVFATRAVPVREPDESIVGGMVLAMDVTDARRSEEVILRLNADLEQSVAELTQANQELEAFSYSVSHDLRAPLRHVSGFVDLLRRSSHDRLDEKGQRQLDTIARAARNMGQLIDDLLAFSRVSRTRLRREPVDMGFLAREVVQPMRVEVEGRVVDWVIGELPRVTGDPSLLRIVLTNLISNAVKYTRTRPRGHIEVGSVAGAADGQGVIYVRDNGVGFDMEYAGKLFGVFQRLHRAEEFEGTGIGLATVRRIVNRHGGHAWASGQLDEGATFYFSLPLAGPAEPATEAEAERSA